MSKIKSNPDFTSDGAGAPAPSGQPQVMVDDDVLELAGDKPEGEDGGDIEGGDTPEPTEDDSEGGEGNQPESSAGDDPDKGEGGEPKPKVDATALEQKRKELQGLSEAEENLDDDLATLESQITARKNAVVEKRTQRRELRKQAGSQEPLPKDEEQDDLADLDQADVKNIERVLKSKGYVRKDQIAIENLQGAQKEVESTFYQQHPQYLPANDANDELYNALQEEMADYAQPKSRAQMERILVKAHEAVAKKFPAKFAQKKGTSTAEADAARRAKLNLAGAGAGNSSASARSGKQSKSNLSAEDIATLKAGGFSDADIAEM